MKSNRSWLGIIVGLMGAVIWAGVGLYSYLSLQQMVVSQADLNVKCRLDRAACIMATAGAAAEYGEAISLAEKLHEGAARLTFDADQPDLALEELLRIRPEYALIFIKPSELDVNVAWKWLQVCSKIDDDPFVDIRSGFITGATPTVVTAFVQRVCDAHSGA